MRVIHTSEAFPKTTHKSIFLAGPSPRPDSPQKGESWRVEAIRLLEEMGFDGDVYYPEWRSSTSVVGYDECIAWETEGLNRADVILFWIPRSEENPAYTTNVEWGTWATSGKVVLGYPDEAIRMAYIQNMADREKVPQASTLRGTLVEAVRVLGDGAVRVDGEAYVPLLVWKHPTFRNWLASQKWCGNSLAHARVLWTFGSGGNVFCWVVKVSVWVEAEQRFKSNEFVIGRTNIAAVLLTYRPEEASWLDTEVLLVKEFRSTVNNGTGYILELPSGSSKTGDSSGVTNALSELREETSLDLSPSRLRSVGCHQVAGTLSAHTCHVYLGQMTKEEWERMTQLMLERKTFGSGESELTYVELRSLRQIMEGDELDWSSRGMILSNLTEETL